MIHRMYFEKSIQNFLILSTMQKRELFFHSKLTMNILQFGVFVLFLTKFDFSNEQKQ